VYFQTAFKHHLQHLGFLLQKDGSGKMAYERAMENYGNDEIFKVINQCIPTDTDLPILHHAIKDAPQFKNDFSIRYLSAMYLRDKDGRSFTQAAIASGSKTLHNDIAFFIRMADDETAELDSVTNQHPFLTCATHESSDLSTTFVLLEKSYIA
jgi:chloramphenicol O-acetyltransferase